MITKYNDNELTEALGNLNKASGTNWTIKDNQLYHSFVFPNFVTAFGFITQVALHAQRLNHHPDWHNSYKTVEFYLSTHKCNGISELDFSLAKVICDCSSKMRV